MPIYYKHQYNEESLGRLGCFGYNLNRPNMYLGLNALLLIQGVFKTRPSNISDNFSFNASKKL